MICDSIDLIDFKHIIMKRVSNLVIYKLFRIDWEDIGTEKILSLELIFIL
jgi:hypothetical protein